MAYYIEELSKQVPLVWFVEREYGSDIWLCRNTGELTEADEVGYVQNVNMFLDADGVAGKYMIVSDDDNSAFKSAFIMAGATKNNYVQFEGDDQLYYIKGELEGVYLADINMHTTLPDSSFPMYSREVDGVVFRGAESEEDLIKCFNMIVSCDLPFIAVIVDESLWNTMPLKRLVFDYWFDHYDGRYLGVSEAESEVLLKLFVESNKVAADGYDVITMDADITTINKRIRALRGDSFREEDIIRWFELKSSSDNQFDLHVFRENDVLIDEWM